MLVSIGLGACLISCSSDEFPVYEPPKGPEVVGHASLYLTTGDQSKLLIKEADIQLANLENIALPTIQMLAEERLQQMQGFGGALTGSSAYLFHRKFNVARQEASLEGLFSDEKGIGLYYLRRTMGLRRPDDQ